jgi:F-type H+-transporting ATPase subunit b
MKKTLFALFLVALFPPLALAAEEGGGDLLKINWTLQLWTLLTFLVMLGLLAKFAFKPIAQALDKRNEMIKASLAEAEKARAEVKKMSDEAKKAIDAARLEGNKILDETRAVAENVRKEIISKANAEAGELVTRAQEEIQRQKQQALVELRQTVADLSVKVSEQVIQQRLDEQLHRQLAEQFIANVAKKK